VTTIHGTKSLTMLAKVRRPPNVSYHYDNVIISNNTFSKV